ncbi:transposase, partial [Bavariicoccus seileri]
RRREKIIRIFPNRASANRLVGALLIDTHEEWLGSTRKYLKFDQ